MKRIALFVLLVALSGALLTGCLTPVVQQSLGLEATPGAGYPPLEITLTATGQSGGSYTFQFEGQTYTQPSPVLVTWIDELPCTVSVTWEGTGGPLSASVTIGLVNQGPVIGLPVLNGVKNLWTIHPRAKYIVTFPDAYDPEGGAVTLIDVLVYHMGQEELNTVFCPPYTGTQPPRPDLYRVRTSQGDIENAFVFFSTWCAPLDEVCNLPFLPPGQGASGYPGGVTCDDQPEFLWQPGPIPGGMTLISATFEDEQKAQTTEQWLIPTMPYPGC